MAEKVEYVISLKDLFTNVMQKAHEETVTFEASMHHLGDTIKEVGFAMGVGFGIEKIVEVGKEILHTTAEFEGFTNVIRYASKDAASGQENLDYLSDSIGRLHLPIKQAYESFSEMESGFYGTAIQGENLRKVFEGVSEAGTVLHLMPDKFSQVTFALKEIGELGTLQGRQMRMLAFAMPGAMNIAAESMHMSTTKFHEAMEKGEINSTRFLLNFSAKLKEHFSGGLANAGNSLIAQMNDVDTKFVRLQTQMGEDLRPVYVSIMNAIIGVVDNLKNGWEFFVSHKEIIEAVSVALKTAGIFYGIYKATMIGMVAVEKMAIVWEKIQYASITLLGNGFLTANGAVKLFAGGLTMILDLLADNPITFAIVAITGLITAMDLYASSTDKAANNTDHLNKSIRETAQLNLDEGDKQIYNIADKYYDGIKGFDKAGKAIHYTITEANKLIAQDVAKQIELVRSSAGDNLTLQDVQIINKLKDYPKVLANRNKGQGKTDMGEDLEKNTKPVTVRGEGQKVQTFNIQINDLIKEFTIATTNLDKAPAKIKEIIVQALLSAVNDSQHVAGR